MSNKYKTTKMFALQVSTHDSMWGGPKQERTTAQKIVRVLILIPAVLVFLLPSFRIGRAIYRKPSFALPDSVKQGTVFTVPADDDVTSIQLSGRDLPELKSKEPMYLVAASSAPELDLVLNYRPAAKKLSLKSLLPHLEHPEYDVFAKQIKIDPPEADGGSMIVGEELSSKAAPVTPAVEPSTFTRTDGLVNASCWKEPTLDELPAPLIRTTRRPPPRQAALTAAGAGEVVQVSAPEKGEKTVIVYHGGGLYTRYYGVRDVRVRRGDHVSAGQQIAQTEAGNWKKPATARWDLFMNQTELNRSSFLALSSQLCDSK